MRTIFALVAERIEQLRDAPDFSAIGIFEQLPVPAFPHTAPNLGVLVRFEVSDEESGRLVEANVGIVDEGGRRDHLDQRRRYLSSVQPGRPPYWDFAINLTSARFDAPGRFTVVIRVDREIVAEVPFLVVGPA